MVHDSDRRTAQSDDSAGSRALGLRDISDILWRRKWYLVLSVLIALGLGVGYLLQAEPFYRSSARVLVQRQSLATEKEKGRSQAGNADEFLATQAEIIRSPAVASRVVAALAKARPSNQKTPPSATSAATAPASASSASDTPVADPVAILLRSLTVTRVLGTNVLSVSFKSASDETATVTVRALINSYRDYLKEIEHDTYTEVLRTLTRNEKDLRNELARLEADYRRLHEDSPLMGQGRDATSVQRSMLVHIGESLSDVTSNRIALENQLEALQQLRKTLEEAGRSPAAGKSGIDKGVRQPAAAKVPVARVPAKSATPGGAYPATAVMAYAAPPAATRIPATAPKTVPTKASVSAAASKPLATVAKPAPARLASAQAADAASPDLPGAASTPLPVAMAIASEIGRGPSSEIEKIRQALFEAQVRAKELSLTYGERHPDVRAAREQVAEWQKRLRESLDVAPLIIERQLSVARRHEEHLTEVYQKEMQKAKEVDGHLIREQQMLDGVKRLQDLHQAAITQLRQFQLVDDTVTQGRAGVTVRVLESPDQAELVVWPPPAMLMGVCLVVGSLGGLGLISILERTDTRVRSALDVQAQLSLAIYGRIPTMPVARRGGTTPLYRSRIVWQAPASLVAEAFRSLRTHLRLDAEATTGTVIQISSARQGEGKTTVTSNLALSFAQLGKKVLVIDADLRRGGLQEIFGVPKAVGLTSVLRSGVPLGEAIVQSPLAPVDVLPQGPTVNNPVELLAQPEFDRALQTLRQQYDVVLVDTPPLLLFTDASVAAPKADAVLLCVTLGTSTVDDVARACELLDKLGARTIGAVVNQDRASHRGHYDYNGRRRYAQQEANGSDSRATS